MNRSECSNGLRPGLTTAQTTERSTMIRSLSQKPSPVASWPCGCGRPAIAADVPAPKRLPFPSGRLLFCPQCHELKKRFEQSQYGLMVKDPAMADFVPT
ncbi:MAG: hypothetical protein Ct9H300mP1_26560 [Planctomycetaceae bacterium]|nr:MAG: hypothetical protein Ct9H300mP1_26560 [Planctomycetaceae bacterium]